MSRAQRVRDAAELHGLLFDGLAEQYGGELPGVDYEIGLTASSSELAQALTAAGANLLVYIIRTPPLALSTRRIGARLAEQRKERAEQRLLRKALTGHVERGLAASRFLAHALVDHCLADAELSSEFSDRLDYATAPPQPIERHALQALRAYAPIGQDETKALRLQRAYMFEGKDELLADPEANAQQAVGFRNADYQLAAAIHAIRMLLGTEYEGSQTARDNSGYSNPLAAMKIGRVWMAPQKRMFEIMRARPEL